MRSVATLALVAMLGGANTVAAETEIADNVRNDCTAGVAVVVEDGVLATAYCGDEPQVVGGYDPTSYGPWVVYTETTEEAPEG